MGRGFESEEAVFTYIIVLMVFVFLMVCCGLGCLLYRLCNRQRRGGVYGSDGYYGYGYGHNRSTPIVVTTTQTIPINANNPNGYPTQHIIAQPLPNYHQYR